MAAPRHAKRWKLPIFGEMVMTRENSAVDET